MVAAGSQEEQGFTVTGRCWMGHHIYLKISQRQGHRGKDLELAELGRRKLPDQLGGICTVYEDLLDQVMEV